MTDADPCMLVVSRCFVTCDNSELDTQRDLGRDLNRYLSAGQIAGCCGKNDPNRCAWYEACLKMCFIVLAFSGLRLSIHGLKQPS